jgi:hypothetical protein
MTVNVPYINKNVLTPNESGDWFQTEFDVKEILAQGFGRLQLSLPIQSPTDSTAYLPLMNTRFPLTIKSLTAKTDAGTCTVAIKINGTNVTSLSAVAVTSTEATTDATAANTMAIGDDLTITPSSVSGVGWLYINIWCDRTGAGTA